VAKFEDKKTTAHLTARRLGDQIGVKFVAFFATVERHLRLVVTDFAHQRFFFVASNVRRIAHDQIEWARTR